MKIRLMPMEMAIRVARVRRDYLHRSSDAPVEILLLHVPEKWFDEDCFLDVEDIDYYGHFLVYDTVNGEEYSIPAWMVSDIVKGREEPRKDIVNIKWKLEKEYQKARNHFNEAMRINDKFGMVSYSSYSFGISDSIRIIDNLEVETWKIL